MCAMKDDFREQSRVTSSGAGFVDFRKLFRGKEADLYGPWPLTCLSLGEIVANFPQAIGKEGQSNK